MFRIAVFASGQGSNFQAMVDAAASGRLGGASVELLVCDKPEAPVVQRAAANGIDTLLFRPKDYASREAYEAEIAAELEQRGIDLVVLAGYMRLITDILVKPYEGRMLNVHPSLLPAFSGKDAIGQAFAYGVKVTGVTVHLVDGGMDTGAVVAQRAVEITNDDTRETLEAKIHTVETELYPAVIAAFAQGKVSVQGRKITLG